jgi:hypothetical protein
MTIVGRNPESGVRVMLELGRDAGPPWTYEGAAYTPSTTHPMRVIVDAGGKVEVEVEVDDGMPQDLVQRARQMVRTAYKHAEDEHLPPPRQIHRWRGGSVGR